MKKILILFFSSMLLLSQSAISQVKKQFKDETFAQTTVIVKEDNANDVEILNDLDLDDIGMGEQIRITTEIERPAPKQIEQTTAAKVQIKEKAVVTTIAKAEVQPEVQPEVKPEAKAVEKISIPVDNSAKSSNLAGAVEKPSPKIAKTTKKRSAKSLKSSKKKVRSKTKRKKRSKKRIKKKKRKKFKKKYSCFKF